MGMLQSIYLMAHPYVGQAGKERSQMFAEGIDVDLRVGFRIWIGSIYRFPKRNLRVIDVSV